MIQKLFLLCCFNISIQVAFSQFNKRIYSETFNSYELGFDYSTEQLIVEQGALEKKNVKSRVKKRYSNGKDYETHEFFNRLGCVTKRVALANGKEEWTAEYTYQRDTLLSELKYSYPNGKQFITTYDYNQAGQLIKKVSINKKGKQSGIEKTYTKAGQLATQSIFAKQSDIPKKKLVYTYYENGDKKTTDLFLKGKLKYSWKYDCKPEGELIGKKQEDQSTICISEEWDESGNRIVWKREFDEEGKMRKFKTVYTPDSLVISREYYSDVDNRKTYDEQISYDENGKFKQSIRTVYPKKGNPYISSKSENLPGHKYRTENYNDKGKIRSYQYYVRDSEGQLLKMERKYRRHKSTYLYGYKDGVKTTEVMIYKKFTVVSEMEYEFYN